MCFEKICVVFELIVIYGNTLTNVWGHGIIKEAYLGHSSQKLFILHSEPKTYFDAENVCKYTGMKTYSGNKDEVNLYIKIKAERLGWNTFEDLWIGFIKHSNSNVWYSTKSSDCIEKSFTIPGQLFHERQCAVLNMSEPSYSGNPNLLYADSCNGRELGFVCLKSSGKIPKAVEFYPSSTVVENGSSRISWDNVTDTECAVNSFSEFFCYAATYFPETGICVAECTDMDNVPENVTLVNSTINSTVLLRTYNKVLINNTMTNLTSVSDPGQIPCLPDTQTTTGISTLASTSEQVTSQCPCTCPTTSNISTVDLQQKITQIKENLTVAKTSLSSSQRKLICAPDERPSSVTMGILGTCVIIGTLFALVGSDLFKVFFITVKFLTRKF
eukprot:XP_019926875.1 PREDICTED: uncharacterized protein LOC105337962 [Crassostrea gigas]